MGGVASVYTMTKISASTVLHFYMGDNQQGVKPYYLTTIGAITADSHDLQYYNLGKSLFAILQRRINSLECERKQPPVAQQ